MAKMNPRLTRDGRKRKELIESLNVKIRNWVVGGSHVKFSIELPNGDSRMLVCPNTGSDRRGEKNMVSMLRKWIRETQTA